jgi:hypothetical protein
MRLRRGCRAGGSERKAIRLGQEGAGPAGLAEAGRVGGMVKVGDKAPEIELLDQDGNEFSLAKSLAANRVWHLIYFYP